MKFRILLILLIIGYTSQAQSTYSKWALEGGVGAFKASDTYSDGYSKSSDISFPQISLGGRYMFNETYGLRATGGYLPMKAESQNDGPSRSTNYFRGSLEGIVDLNHFLRMGNPQSPFTVMAHAGGGGSKVGGDFFFHYTAGLMPQYKINDKVSLFGDISYFGHKYQNITWDNRVGQDDGHIWAATIGVVYTLDTDRIPWSRRIRRR